MIFGLGDPRRALDAQFVQVLTQPRKRALVQEPGKIVGAVGQQLAAADPDKEIEKLALDLFRFRGRVGGGFRSSTSMFSSMLKLASGS
jgi:hypothetical protein